MGFESYKGSIQMAAGMKPAAEGYPLMQSCDIQVDEEGTRLDAFLAKLPKVVPISQQDYNDLVAAGNVDPMTLYLIVDEVDDDSS